MSAIPEIPLRGYTPWGLALDSRRCRVAPDAPGAVLWSLSGWLCRHRGFRSADEAIEYLVRIFGRNPEVKDRRDANKWLGRINEWERARERMAGPVEG